MPQKPHFRILGTTSARNCCWYVDRVILIHLRQPDRTYFQVIDNHRVLHGRSAFDGKRRMCGAYVGIDEYKSKLAVLQEQFALDTVQNATENLPQTSSNSRSVWHPAL